MHHKVISRVFIPVISVALVCTARAHVSPADPITIKFEDPEMVSGSHTYSYDIPPKDGCADVVFTTPMTDGFRPPAAKMLGGHPTPSDYEVIVEFRGGATGDLSYGFWVSAQASGYDAYIFVPHPEDPYRFVTAYAEANNPYGRGYRGRLRVTLTDGKGPFTAKYAYLQFYTGGNENHFYMDDFTGTFGLAPTAAPIPKTVLLLGTGLMGLVGFRRQYRPQ